MSGLPTRVFPKGAGRGPVVPNHVDWEGLPRDATQASMMDGGLQTHCGGTGLRRRRG